MFKDIIDKLDALLSLQQHILTTLMAVEKVDPKLADEWLDNTDVKRLLKISDSSLYRLRSKGILPCKRMAGKWYYSKLAIANIITG